MFNCQDDSGKWQGGLVALKGCPLDLHEYSGQCKKKPVKAEAWKTFFGGWVAPADRCKLVRAEERKKTKRTMWSLPTINFSVTFISNWLVVSIFLVFNPNYLGKSSNLTSIFFRWVETQPPTSQRGLASKSSGPNS